MTDQTVPNEQPKAPAITAAVAHAAEELFGLTFTDSERALALDGLNEHREQYEKLRTVPLSNDVPPAFRFDPRLPTGTTPNAQAREPIHISDSPTPPLPADLEEVAFWPVTWLSQLIKTRQVTSRALTEMYLARLKRYDPILHCIAALTEDRALAQADQADSELAKGKYRGPLHGIPWGAKDLLATRGIQTAWGAEPYQGQVFDYDATVIERLDAAGAVLVAKLSVGALAWGDVWYGGLTRSPWNTSEGASGSSAGSGSATAAGLVGFSIGTETLGSIVSPSTQCRVTGLRPTFGRVSRHGAMALSWTMDKIGPMCRSVEDCALVFDAIYGPDGKDPTVSALPFQWSTDVRLSDLRIGYVKDAFEAEHATKEQDDRALNVLRDAGVDLIPIQLPDLPVEAIAFILNAEAAAAFDELTRNNQDDLLTRQVKDAWPNVFRQARLIPAVEYIQAQRVRTLIMQAMEKVMQDIDVFVAPSFEGSTLLLTNMTGHPAVVVPNGTTAADKPVSLTFIGKLYGEANALAVAKAWQDATAFHQERPVITPETS